MRFGSHLPGLNLVSFFFFLSTKNFYKWRTIWLGCFKAPEWRDFCQNCVLAWKPEAFVFGALFYFVLSDSTVRSSFRRLALGLAQGVLCVCDSVGLGVSLFSCESCETYWSHKSYCANFPRKESVFVQEQRKEKDVGQSSPSPCWGT